MRRTTTLLLGFLLVLHGCSLAPEYVRPAPPVPPAWSVGESGTDSFPEGPAGADISWRESFTDPALRSVIELALANNRDLRAAALEVDRVRALFRIQRSELFPSVGLLASGEGYRVPDRVSDTGEGYTAEQYSVDLGTASWELDFFGRVRSLKDRALEQYLATEQARTASQISLVAAVATSYLALAADLENLRLAEATLETQQAAYELIRGSRDLGIATDLDLRQAQSQVDAARVDAARFAGLAAVDRHALDLLAGATVPDGLLPAGLGETAGMRDVSPGLPSDVLLRRPDILAAEHVLKAANASIGAARAAFFPRISLTAAVGTMSDELSGLFGSGTGTWTFIPQLTLPIFTGGSRRAALDAARVERDIAVAQYEKAIQTAFREVSDALTLRTTLRAQEEAQRSLVDALAEAYRLADARYRAGIDSYLNVLVAQRALYVARQGLVGVRLAGEANSVALFKALGGGAPGADAAPARADARPPAPEPGAEPAVAAE